ncbi:hypothetical protein WA158_003802 [Blastocystis sp. Blastoise]
MNGSTIKYTLKSLRTLSTVRPQQIISIAPMLDVTTRYQRYVMRKITKHATLYTEMVVDSTLFYQAGYKRDRLLKFDPCEHPVVFQFGGNNPQVLSDLAVHVQKEGYDEIDINCGCPSPKVAKGSFGVTLMLYPQIVAQIVKEIKSKVTVPVTVKCRLGVDSCNKYEDLCNFISKVHDTGCHHFIVHCRHCYLDGGNAKYNRRVPQLNYLWIYRLLDDFPTVNFTINGDINSLEKAKELLDTTSPKGRYLSGAMIGRLAMNDPYALHTVDSMFYNDNTPIPCRAQIIKDYILYIQQLTQNPSFTSPSISILSRPIINLFKGIPNGSIYKQTLQGCFYVKKMPLYDSLCMALRSIPPSILYNMDENTYNKEKIQEYCDFFKLNYEPFY